MSAFTAMAVAMLNLVTAFAMEPRAPLDINTLCLLMAGYCIGTAFAEVQP